MPPEPLAPVPGGRSEAASQRYHQALDAWREILRNGNRGDELIGMLTNVDELLRQAEMNENGNPLFGYSRAVVAVRISQAVAASAERRPEDQNIKNKIAEAERRAAQKLQDAIDAYPEFLPAHLARADYYIQQSNMNIARSALTRAQQILEQLVGGPDRDSEYWLQLERGNETADLSGPEMDTLALRANAPTISAFAQTEGWNRDGREAATNTAATNPESIIIRFRAKLAFEWARLLRKEKLLKGAGDTNPEAAREYAANLEFVLQIDPNFFEAKFARAQIQVFVLGDFDGAAAALEPYFENPKQFPMLASDPDLNYFMAQIETALYQEKHRADNFAQAVVYADRVINKYSENWRERIVKSIALYEFARHERSSKALVEADAELSQALAQTAELKLQIDAVTAERVRELRRQIESIRPQLGETKK